MSFSAAPLELPFVVYTNSPDDYRVTAHSRQRMSATEHLIGQLAGRCDRWINKDFQALVGVLKSPESANRLLAFRVFDAGEYYGRPHTLAIVAIETPRRGERIWRLGQLLGSLAAPPPGGSSYHLPTEEAIQRADARDEPFASLDAWEERHGDDAQEIPITFGRPAGTKLHLEDLSPPGVFHPAKRRPPFLLAGLTVLVLLGILAAITAWYSHRIEKQLPAKRSPGPSRQELLLLLRESGVELPADPTDADIASTVVGTAHTLQTRMSDLAHDLTSHQQDPPSYSEPIVSKFRRDWQAEAPMSATVAAQLDAAALEAAIIVHRAYQAVRHQLDHLAMLDREKKDFADALQDLQRQLQKPTATETLPVR